MYRTKTHKVPDRIVSISQHWVRPIVRGKQNADVEFGAKVEMSIVDGFRMGCQTVAGVSVTMHTVSSSPSGIRLKRT